MKKRQQAIFGGVSDPPDFGDTYGPVKKSKCPICNGSGKIPGSAIDPGGFDWCDCVPRGSNRSAGVVKAKYLSILSCSDPDNQVIIDQIETNLSDEQVIELDAFLRKNGVLNDKLELALTEDL